MNLGALKKNAVPIGIALAACVALYVLYSKNAGAAASLKSEDLADSLTAPAGGAATSLDGLFDKLFGGAGSVAAAPAPAPAAPAPAPAPATVYDTVYTGSPENGGE